MAVAGGEGKSPRVLLCLTVARWSVATVVGALAATALLLILTVGLRPESMSVSVNHGHFQVARALWLMHDFQLSHYPNDHNSGQHIQDDDTTTLAVYGPADHVAIWVSMNFQIPGCNSSGGGVSRGGGVVVVYSNVTAVSIFDMPNAPSFVGMMRIYTLPMEREICHFYRGVLDRWVYIHDQDTLSYIARTYGGRSEFTVMVQVDTRTITNTATGKRAVHYDTHYCWPVTIGHRRSITAEAITCKPNRGINYTVDSGVLAPPPAPPPNTPPPPQICELCN